MFDIFGRYGKATIFANTVEETALSQLNTLLSQPFIEGSKIAVMPDVHAGSGCTIGYTQTINGRVCPNLVGVDINCGMLWVELGKIVPDMEALDAFIHKNIPCGMEVNEEPCSCDVLDRLTDLRCYKELKNIDRLKKSCGSLGGGNHFIELDSDDSGNIYLVIHTGSRNLGKQVAEYYQEIANRDCNFPHINYKEEVKKLVDTLKTEGRTQDIQSEIALLRKKVNETLNVVPKDLAWLEGKHLDDYLHDMRICSSFANANRLVIADRIVKHLLGKPLAEVPYHETVHNYVDTEHMIIRKGAISLESGELALIPINMRDGSLIVRGKGNPEYNFSGPHGAGRLMSRSQARDTIELTDFKEAMKGIYTTCVETSTLDESPMAYKGMDDILNNIGDTADVLCVIRPIYNFKAV